MSVYLSMYLSVYPSRYIYIYLSIYLCIYLSVYLCIYRSELTTQTRCEAQVAKLGVHFFSRKPSEDPRILTSKLPQEHPRAWNEFQGAPPCIVEGDKHMCGTEQNPYL